MNFIKGAVLSILAIFAPIKVVMITIVVVIIMDLILGVWAAMKRSEEITSAALRRTVSKIVIYEVAIIAAFITEKFLLDGSLPVVKLAAGAIGMVEIKSILENLNTINGSPIFASLVQTLGSKNDTKPET